MSRTNDSHYLPSPSERVRNQVARYEATDGADGGDLDGRPVVVLTTRGATSGTTRKTPIMRVVDGDAYVAIASYAGNPRNPSWYRNLVAHPDAEIRDRARRIRVRAQPGFASLDPDDQVEFRYEDCWGVQDSWHYRTTWVRRLSTT